MKLKFLLPLFIFISFILFLYFGLKLDPNHLPSILLGKKVPTFELTELLKPKHPLTQKIFLGKVSILNVWASWCPTCRAEHEILQNISQNYMHKIQIYGLNYKDQRQDALQWLKEL